MDVNAYLTSIAAIMKYSIKKVLFNKQWMITLLIMIFIGAIMGYAGSEIESQDRLDAGAELMDILILSFIMPVIAMIYGASLLRNEIEDKSITQVITAPIDRAISYLAYYLSLAVSLSIILIAICLVGWLAFFGQMGMGGDAGAILGAMIVLCIIGSLAYSAMFILTSVLFKRPIYFGLFFAFIWEGFIGSAGGAIGKYTIKHFVRSIGSTIIDYGSLSQYPEATAGTYATLLMVIVICLGIGAMIFREKEFP